MAKPFGVFPPIRAFGHSCFVGANDLAAVAAFLERYAAECEALGVEPLTPGDVADLAALIIGAPATLH